MSAIQHPFFKEEPLPCEKLNLPCEESHEADIKRYKEEMHQAMSQKAPSAPRGHVIETGSETGSVPVFPRAPKAKTNFPTGPAASSRRPPPVSGGAYNRNQNPRFNYNNNNTNTAGHGGISKPPHTTNFHRSRYSSRYGNNNSNNNNTNLPSGPQHLPANAYQHRNGPPPYMNSMPQKPSRYQGTNEKYYQQHHLQDQGSSNNKNNFKTTEARSSRATGTSAPLPRGPATTQVPHPPPSIPMPRENMQQNRIPSEEQGLNGDSKNQESSKDGNGTTGNSKKDIADLY